MSTQTIQAIRINNYGSHEDLRVEEIQRPVPLAGEVLVHVHASAVNPIDWKLTSGWLKEFMPIQFPYIPGRDLAGVVEEVGPGVTAFQKGQAVFGQSTHGAYTEYTAASVETLALKPKTLSFDEAATIPVGATTAWQGLFDHGHLQPGQRVLILGGAGGVGLFAVQFARWKGAHVMSTTSTANVEYVRSLGAEAVIDYSTTAIEGNIKDVDLVLDTVGAEALASAWPALKRGGTLVSTVGQPDKAKAEELNVRAVPIFAQVSSGLLSTFAQLIDEGQVKVAISQVFPLSEASQAHALSESGHGRGRIVLHTA